MAGKQLESSRRAAVYRSLRGLVNMQGTPKPIAPGWAIFSTYSIPLEQGCLHTKHVPDVTIFRLT